jgi:hypothetical protein
MWCRIGQARIQFRSLSAEQRTAALQDGNTRRHICHSGPHGHYAPLDKPVRPFYHAKCGLFIKYVC